MAGSSVPAARFVSHQLGPFTIAAVSLLLAALSLLPFCLTRMTKTLARLKPFDWLALVGQALCGIFLFRVFMLFGLRYTSASEAGFLTGATPAVTAFLAWIVLKEQPRISRVLGVLCTAAGILLMQRAALLDSGFSSGHLWGNLLVLGAAASESAFNVLSRRHSLRSGSQPQTRMNPIVQSVLVCSLAFLLCLVPALLEGITSALIRLDESGWLALIWYGPFVTALGYVCWYAGIRRCSASTAAIVSGVMPFTALLLSVLFLGEKLSVLQWAGGMLVAAGMLAAGLPDSRKESGVQTTESTAIVFASIELSEKS